MALRKFKDELVSQLKSFEEAKAYLMNAIEEKDEEFLLDAINLVIEAWGPTKISELAGGSKQKWNSLKNPTYKTIREFLSAFNLKLVAVAKDQ